MKQFNSIEEYRNLRKRSKRIKVIVSIVVITLIAVFTGFLVKQSGVLERGISGLFSDSANNFPVSMSGERALEMDSLSDGTVVLLTERQIYFYSKNGKILRSSVHGSANPVIRISGKSVLLYDLGGYKFSVENKKETVFAKEIKEKILLCDLSNSGLVASVTESSRYTNQLTVYDADGSLQKYKWYTSDEHVTALALKQDAKGCVLAGIKAEDGVMKAIVHGLDFDKEKESFKTVISESMPISIGFQGKDITVAGMDSFFVLSEKGKESAGKANESIPAFIQNDFDGGTVMLTVDEVNGTTKAAVIDSAAKEKAEAEIPGKVLDTATDGNKLYVLTYKKIFCYDSSLNLIGSRKCNKDIKGITASGDYVYMLGANEISRAEWK